MKKESLEDKDTRMGGENEVRGSKDAQRALKPRQPKRQGRKNKR